MPASRSPAAQVSARAAMTALVVTLLVSFSSIVPERPDRVRWLSLFWLAAYASGVLAQAAWLAWRWISHRHA